MTSALEIAKSKLLIPTGIDENQLDQLLGQLLGPSVDNADLYFQFSRQESWVLEDGIVKDGSHTIDQGVGARAISGEKTGFAYSDEITMPALIEASKAARAISRQGQNGQLQAWKRDQSRALYMASDPIATLSNEQKVEWLRKIDAHTRARDPRVTQVIISMAATHDQILVAASDGTLAGDNRPLVRLGIQVIVEQNNRRESGNSGGGGRYDLMDLLHGGKGFAFAEKAVDQALINLEAIDAPAGTMTVVLGSGWPGILLHEAIGHGLEGDFNRKGTSAFAGRIGEQVASPLCTIVDDGTLEKRRGSLSIDDEGTPSECTTLIEKGILKNYMQDKLNARLMGEKTTGNGRRESFAHLPMPRMTNTYMLNGEHSPDEILASVDKGLYAVNFGGGQVDITSGQFVFSASEAYLIENGKLGAPVKGATLIGNGPDVLNQVSMVGNDLSLDDGVGVCGKEGQSVPVGVGQPTLKIDQLTVGGTQT